MVLIFIFDPNLFQIAVEYTPVKASSVTVRVKLISAKFVFEEFKFKLSQCWLFLGWKIIYAFICGACLRV